MYDVNPPYPGRSYRMYGDLPPPYVIEDWKRRQERRRPTQPVQIPLPIPIPPEKTPTHDTDKKETDDRGVIIIDLASRSLDTLIEF